MEEKKLLPTNEIASRLGVQGATMRRSLCVKGHYIGLKPVKLPNNRLLWSERELNRLLEKNSE